MQRVVLSLGLVLGWQVLASAQVTTIDFEDLALAPESFWNGEPKSGGAFGSFPGPFFSRGAAFENTFTREDFGGFTFETWSGWSYSNRTDVTTPGFMNQYSAYHLPGGGGAGGSANFGVAYAFDPDTAVITLPAGTRPVDVHLTNTTYAALSMRDGDSFAKKFGGPTGNDPDFFRVIITGRDESHAVTGQVAFLLADYRLDAAEDYIISEWTRVDLTPLGAARFLSLTFESSDVGPFGINTPTYVALDNLRVQAVPEPGTWALAAVGLGSGFAIYRRKRRRKLARRRS